MKIVLAPDSFKGNMRSPEVCDVLECGIRRELPAAEVIKLPMADGGEGTTEAIARAWGEQLNHVQVTGPVGAMVRGGFAVSRSGAVAVMEMASASGIELVPAGQLDPMRATSYGTGELLRNVLATGAGEVVIGLGGSATVDGGVGMAQALGFRFLDDNGRDVPFGGRALLRIAAIDATAVHPRLKNARIRVACDVTNPLLGSDGAARVYGPQKGASAAMVRELEEGLTNLKRQFQRAGFHRPDAAGDGAAGGMGYALRCLCGAEVVSGAKLVTETVGLEHHLLGAHLMITGEGRTDDQTAAGKLCQFVAAIARSHHVPAWLISGALGGNPDHLLDMFDVAVSISAGHTSLDECMAHSRRDLAYTVRNALRCAALWQDNCLSGERRS